MAYSTVVVYSLDGEFLGYAIKRDDLAKLHSEWIYEDTDEERLKLGETIANLNREIDLKSVWPDARDPEVVAFLSDDDWEPIEKAWTEVVDDDNSVYTYIKEPDEETGELGIIDKENSFLVFKDVLVPVRPSDVMSRVKKACETVARKRAGLDA